MIQKSYNLLTPIVPSIWRKATDSNRSVKKIRERNASENTLFTIEISSVADSAAEFIEEPNKVVKANLLR